MASLNKSLRRDLENTVKKARRVAEAGARKALEQLAVHHHEHWPSLSPGLRLLRNRLRIHGRRLGDKRDERRETQAIERLVGECAYEHWHRMLFARFLAENDLLIEPGTGVAITMAECQELARDQARDWLEMASGFAVGMLPQIFRTGDPTLEIALPPETRSELEDLLKALPREAFLTDDSLGWVYQFWQVVQKKAINKSEKKIGADELPAVTQLFTEDYMVEFLLHNTLGAWWAGKVLAANPELAKNAKDEDELREICAVGEVHWTYLRFVREGDGCPWRPAAGTFEGWPKTAREITLLDPCMGSGHFLVFALPILAALRGAEEAMTEAAAVEAVLRDNLFGLEIDPRCTQIAAFNLALAAWRRLGHRPLPPLNLACSGLSIGVSKTEWLRLAEEAAAASSLPPDRDLFGSKENLFIGHVKAGLISLYDLFTKAPWLGSLINPRRAGGDLLEAGFDELEPLLTRILANGHDAELTEMAVAAHGMAKAAELLARQFTLVATNVPYLGREGHSEEIMNFADSFVPDAASDLATLMLQRCVDYVCTNGTVSVVLPQNWWVGKSYSDFRSRFLTEIKWNFAAVLGEEAWQTFANRGPNTVLLIANSIPCPYEHFFSAIDVSTKPGNPVVSIEKKAHALAGDLSTEELKGLSELVSVDQQNLRRGRNSRISVVHIGTDAPLSNKAISGEGCSTGDNDHYLKRFWELSNFHSWLPYCGPGFKHWLYCDTSLMIFWENGHGQLARSEQARIQNTELWKRRGILVGRVRGITATIFPGGSFSKGAVLVCPRDEDDQLTILTFLRSKEYENTVRAIDPRVSASTSVVTDVPFNLTYWQKVAAEKYPNGLPKPHSDDPTQWLFNGHPQGSDQPLQVAVARLIGYRWPRQTGSSFPDCPALGPDGLEQHADADGIVCLPPLNREPPAATRLRALIAAAFGADWSAAKERDLLSAAGSKKTKLEDWLLDEFFEQHCALFHQRPFIWHVWDGRRDGFHALVNYHKLSAPGGEGQRTLEKLIYTCLGDWIVQQRQDQQAGVEGADARVASAVHLQDELKKILAGEPPYDLFIRWKPLHEQPIGWDPDISDGVRMSIRPFLTARPLGTRAKNACILRSIPKIKWDKDRGKEPMRPKEAYPWFWSGDEKSPDFVGGKEFNGIRWNDLHYTNDFKRVARERRDKP